MSKHGLLAYVFPLIRTLTVGLGISPSPVGTAIAQQHLRIVLATLDMPALGQPEMFLQMKDGFFDESGNVNEHTRKFIKGWIDRFLTWVSINKGV